MRKYKYVAKVEREWQELLEATFSNNSPFSLTKMNSAVGKTDAKYAGLCGEKRVGSAEYSEQLFKCVHASL